jgi:hypothetical protein
MAHPVSMRPGSSQKSIHKRGQRLWDDTFTEKERLTYFDQAEAAIVPLALEEDPDFQFKGRELAGRPPRERRAAAQLLAKDYAPNKSKSGAQELIVDLLLLMAEEPWREKGIPRRVFFANLTSTAVWADAPLDELDGRRARERRAMLNEGAQALVYGGAGKCMHCGTPLASDRYGRGASGQRSRRTHCGRCCPASIVASGLNAKRKALDAATGLRRRYRAARRVV